MYTTSTTLYPDQDTYFDWNDPNTPHGSLPQLLAYTITGASGRMVFSYVRFNLSGIPASSIINSASLSLYAESLPTIGNTFTSARNVTTSWTEALVGSQPYTGFESSTTTVNSPGLKTWDVQSATQKMVNGTNPNYGWEISTGPGTQIIFSSRERTGTTYDPLLQVNYTYYQ
jgi:hypothetical protein